MKSDETIGEICDLIRIPRLDLFKTYEELADRILAAYEREMAAKDAEIATLKAALKPVMEVHLNDGGTTPISDSMCAVAEAQRVMKKSTNGESHN